MISNGRQDLSVRHCLAKQLQAQCLPTYRFKSTAIKERTPVSSTPWQQPESTASMDVGVAWEEGEAPSTA